MMFVTGVGGSGTRIAVDEAMAGGTLDPGAVEAFHAYFAS